jgi:hypothetical protein
VDQGGDPCKEKGIGFLTPGTVAMKWGMVLQEKHVKSIRYLFENRGTSD